MATKKKADTAEGGSVVKVTDSEGRVHFTARGSEAQRRLEREGGSLSELTRDDQVVIENAAAHAEDGDAAESSSTGGASRNR